MEISEALKPLRAPARRATRATESDSLRRTHCLVLLLYRYNERGLAVLKPPLVEEAIDLVRRRKSVAEKLYFHRTKIAASAMLIAAVDASNPKAIDYWELSDLEVLKRLADEQSPPHSRRLAQKLLARQLFKPIYRASHHQRDESAASRAIDDAYERFIDPSTRRTLMRKLEWVIGEKRCGGKQEDAIGTVSIFCPTRGMNLKAFDMRVLHEPAAYVQRLEDSMNPPTKMEIGAIKQGHEHLWRLEVFVDPDVVDLSVSSPFTRDLVGAIQQGIGPKNEMTGFRDLPNRDIDEWIHELKVDAAVRELGVPAVSHTHFGELVAGLSLRDGCDYAKEVRAWLTEKGYQVKGEQV